MQLLGRVIERAVLAFLWVTLPLSPPVLSIISGDTRHMRYWGATLRQSAMMLRSMARAEVIARRIASSAARETRERAAWRIAGECSHCGNCCLDRSCVFLSYDGQGHSRCSIYGNWFFRRLTCGGYPITREDIELYDCPSFRALPREQAGAASTGSVALPSGRIIPIAVLSTVEPASGCSMGNTARRA